MEKSHFQELDRYLLIVLIIGIVVFAAELYFVPKIQPSGGTLPYNTNIAENLLNGKGFTLDFVDEYYIKFDSVSHPDEWGFTMMGILTAPFIYFFGKTALAVRLPTIIIGAIFLPIVVYFLGKELFERKIGFLAAVSMLFFSETFDLTFTGQRDVVFSFFLLAAVYFFYKGFKEQNQKYFYLMGVFLAITYLVRQTALIIFPLLFVIHYLFEKKIDLKVIKGLLLGLLILAPWFLRSYLIFGDPFFSVNKYAVWIYGFFENYDPLGYLVYWDTPKPSYSWIGTLHLSIPLSVYTIFKIIKDVAVEHALSPLLNLIAFLGLLLTSRKKIERPLLLSAAFIVIVTLLSEIFLVVPLRENALYLIFWAAPYAAMLYIATFVLAKESPRNKLFAVFWGGYAGLHVFYAFPELRFMLPLIPLFFIFSWAGVKNFLERLSKAYTKINNKYFEGILILILLLFIIINVSINYINLSNAPQYHSLNAPKEDEKKLVELVKIATEQDSVIMVCNAISMHDLAGRKTVEMPSDSMRRIFDVIQHYKVSYITFSRCEGRLIEPELFRAVFGAENPPAGYSKAIYKISPSVEKEGEETLGSLNPLRVGWIDENGKAVWTTEHLKK